MVSNSCVAGRPIKSALVRCQYRIGLCPKMKYPPFYGGIFISVLRERNEFPLAENAAIILELFAEFVDGGE